LKIFSAGGGRVSRRPFLIGKIKKLIQFKGAISEKSAFFNYLKSLDETAGCAAK
jgi:hypothetical protein